MIPDSRQIATSTPLPSDTTPVPGEPNVSLEDMSLTGHVMTILDLRDRRIWGFEILVRGVGHEGIVPPDVLMDLAKRTGQLTSFDRRCFESTSRTIPNLPHDAHAFLNIYAQTLLEPGGVEFALGVLAPYLAEGRKVVLEIHESMTVGELAELEPIFTRIKNGGVKIALDDLMPKDLTFRHLRIRPDYIKVDRFVFSKMTPVETARAISTFARCQESLGYELIVEGIEDDKMLSIVSFAGAFFVQGYLFGKPAPHDVKPSG